MHNMILIYSDQENAQVGLPAGTYGGTQVRVPNPNHYRRLDGEAAPASVGIGGAWIPERTYAADGHFLVVEAEDADQASLDAGLILALSGFRLADSSEQNAFTAARQGKSGSLKEGGQGKGNGKGTEKGTEKADTSGSGG